MTDVTPQFAKLMVTLAAAYTTAQAKLSEAQIRVYFAALSDIPHDQLASACLRAVRENQWFPTCAELRRFVEASPEDRALLAWNGLQTAAAEVGAYASLELEDVCAAEALCQVFGSWPGYCALDSRDVSQRKSDYLAAYRAARRSAQPPVAAVALPGLCQTLGTPASALPEAPTTWRGRLTVQGQVVVERDRPQLPEVAINRLIEEGGPTP